MKQTFGTLINMCQDGAGKDTSTASQSFFKRQINSRYEQVISYLPSFVSEATRTFATVTDQQYYAYPPMVRQIKEIYITIANVDYHLTPIHSYKEWTDLNAIDIQSGAIPRFYFKRARDFGIWPIPQAAYTGTIVNAFRASGLTADDYTTGTVTVTENDATIVGSGTTFTGGNAKADYYFSLADTNGFSRGSWYRIGSITDATNLELESVFEEVSEAGVSYIIGQSPELPDEMHELLSWGALADYFAGFRQSQSKAQGWSNMFWTGDWNNNSRDEERVMGGLIGLSKRYKDRNEDPIVYRKTKSRMNDKLFATTISNTP